MAIRAGYTASGRRLAAGAPIQNRAQFSGWSGPAARMPDRAALQVHLLAIAERIATLCAARARRMKVVVLAGLQHLAANEAAAVGALDAKQLLVALLAVRYAVLAHILAVQHGRAVLAAETPDVPLALQRHQCLALLQLVTAAGTVVRIVVTGAGARRCTDRSSAAGVLRVCRRLGRTAAGDLLDR